MSRSPWCARTSSTATSDGALARPDRVEAMGLEPTTPCLQSRCSSQLSYAPGEESA